MDNKWAAGVYQEKYKLYVQYLKNPYGITNDRYKTFKNKLNHLIRISHKHYINNYLNNHYNDLKKSWELINNLLHRK